MKFVFLSNYDQWHNLTSDSGDRHLVMHIFVKHEFPALREKNILSSMIFFAYLPPFSFSELRIVEVIHRQLILFSQNWYRVCCDLL